MKASILLRIETDDELEQMSDKELLKFVKEELSNYAIFKSIKGYVMESNYNKPDKIVYKR